MTTFAPKNYGNILQILFSRAKISEAQVEDIEFMQAAVNEYYQMILSERSWTFRKMDRAINFDVPETTGTVAVVSGSRSVTFTGLTVDKIHLGRTLRFNKERELYRVIGWKPSTNSLLLDANYVGEDNPLATYKMYFYEIALPPDCDDLKVVHIDSNGINYSTNETGQLEDMDSVEFNRWLSIESDFVGPPTHYSRDGTIFQESLPPLDEMSLEYDFLGGEQFTKIARLRLWPIEPDKNTIIHINYTRIIDPLIQNDQEPILPLDQRWILIHYPLGEWYAHHDSPTLAEKEFARADKKLAEMRQKYSATDSKPKMVVDGRCFRRVRRLNDYKLLHKMSRIGESN